MTKDEASDNATVSVPVRSGPYQYLRVRADGTSSTIPIDSACRDRGRADVRVAHDEVVMEIALKSTSDPDLDPARGQLWPRTEQE